MITKKITLLVFLIFCSINVFAKYKYEKLADFEWNNKSGFETKLTHSGNYAILSFEILDNNRVAFLSNVEKNIKIYSKDGKFLNAFDLDFIPEDFVYNNNKFYVLSNYSIYEFNDSGALIKKYSVNKEFKFINRLSAFKNDLYVLTSDEKSYPVIKNSLYLDTISQINNETNGWLLSENFKCKTIKLSNNTFSLQISNQKNLNLEKIYDLDKKLATATILGKYKSKLFLNIEYFKNEAPIKIEREILVYSLTEKEIVNKIKLPNMNFIYMKHDIKINDNGIFYFIATPKKGILYQLFYDEKLNKDIVPNFKEEYHYNEHLLRSKEGSIKNSFPEEELPISRAEIIQNAAEYESLEWTATSSNISDGIVQTPDGAYIDTPDWVTIGQKQKVPYKWGGWTEINTFVAQISNGVYAGDNYCESVSWGPTYCVGVDCSGLVSRVWNLSQKYGTYTLQDISTVYSTFNELKHGDIINKAGYHVRLVISDNPTGTINTIESSAVDWRVSYRDYDINDLVDYTPRYYNYIQNLEMASPIVITPNPMIYEEQVTATISITNFGDVDWAGNIYMAIHDNDGNFLYNIDAEEGEGVTIANNETEDFEFQDILEFDNYNGPGIYEIHLKYQTNGTGNFYLVPPVDNYTNPIDVEIEETTIINVPGDYSTIQAGIDASANGDIVLVDTGTYYENINFNGKNITVASHFLTTQDTSYISQTIIDGNQNGSVVTFENGEDSTSVLSGFTITNGYAQGSYPDNCGGGIYCGDSSPSLKNITITDNSSEYGGGFFCENSSTSLKNVNLIGNSSSYYGGGIYCYDESEPSLENVTIADNIGGEGGGIYLHGSSPILENVTITGNSTVYAGGIFCGYSSHPSLINCILWNDNPQEIYFNPFSEPNSITVSYSDIEGGESGIVTNYNGTVYWLDGNIDSDPLFVDQNNGDYHLTEFSPCIDTGDPTSPLDPDGTIADMGAYYYDQSNYDITFNSLADMNTARYGFAYANDGDCLYAICGGTYEPPFYRVNNIEKYNPTTNNWVEFVDGLIPRRYCKAEYIQSTNKIYIFGGQTYYVSNPATYTDTVEVVDVANGNITYLTSNPNPYTNSGSAVWDNKIYIFGGSEHGVYLNELYEFDPINNVWNKLPDMPEAKQTEGEVVDGILYVFGGYNGSQSNRIDAYDIQNNEWSFIGYMPEGISAHHTTVKGQYIWIVGDYDILNYVAIFNTETHEFTQLNTNMIGRRHCGTEVIGNNLYVYGGNVASGGPALSSLQCADISYLSINDEPHGISSSITLFQNYPNPFNPKTTISFSIKQNCKIELEIFNIKGQKVKTLINESRQSGYYAIPWNGDDNYGNRLSSGLYFYKLCVDGKTEVVKKCLLVK